MKKIGKHLDADQFRRWLETFRLNRRAWGGYPAARAIGFGVAFALFDEAHQYGIPGRTPSLVDGCLDVLGLAAGWCAAQGGR